MAVITISRESGSGGGAIAQLLARTLGYHLVDDRVLRAVAQHGNAVILGRGGYAALREVADVLNVRVQAPLAVRARRMVERGEAAGLEAAQALAGEHDKRRATFLKLSYGLAWDSAQHFDLVVDTAKLSPESACALIARAARDMRSPEGQARVAAELEVDSVLTNVLTGALGCRTPHDGRAREEPAPAPSPGA